MKHCAAWMNRTAPGDGICVIFTAPMEVLETKNKNKKYKPILEGIPDWPVYQLSKNRKEFIEEVVQEALTRIRDLRPGPRQLAEELETTVYREQQRMKRNRWRVDPPDEPRFWAKIKEELSFSADTSEEEIAAKTEELLHRIVSRYANEIAGNFKPSSSVLAARW